MGLMSACSLAAGTTFFLTLLDYAIWEEWKCKKTQNYCNKRAFPCKRNSCCVFPSITYVISLKQDSILSALFWNSILLALFSFLTWHHPAGGKKRSQHDTTSEAKVASLLENKTALKMRNNLKKGLTYNQFPRIGSCYEVRLRNQAQIVDLPNLATGCVWHAQTASSTACFNFYWIWYTQYLSAN